MPISNNIRGNAKGLCHHLIAAKALYDFVCHAPLSQIVIVIARGNYHNLGVAGFLEAAHCLVMSNQDKNGGPNHLREWREFRGLSQSALADRVGTNANVIQYLETGERGLSAKWLRKLAPALDTTPGMLLDHDPTSLDTDILDIWSNASDRQRRQIKEIAETLLRIGSDN